MKRKKEKDLNDELGTLVRKIRQENDALIKLIKSLNDLEEQSKSKSLINQTNKS